MKRSTTAWGLVCLALMMFLLLPANGALAQGEGIKVHGHWKLEIFNPDGTLERVVEFDNALSAGGNSRLVEILARNGSVGRWQIHTNNSEASSESPCTDQGTASSCIIEEGPDPAVSYAFGGLSIGTNTPSNPSKLILAGSMVVGASIAKPKGIGVVQTYMAACGPAVTPTDCALQIPSGVTEVTAKILDSEVPVQPGQTVQITVEISFS